MTDYLESLPTDEEPLDDADNRVIDTILKENRGFSWLLLEAKPHLVYGAIFLAFSIIDVGKIIKLIVPYTNSSNIALIAATTILFMVTTFLVGMFLDN